jgi:hypothetical protein
LKNGAMGALRSVESPRCRSLSDFRYAGVEELVPFTGRHEKSPAYITAGKALASSIGTAGFEPATP